MHRFISEIQEELQEIYDWKYPMHPCPICGTLMRKTRGKIYCSDKCLNKSKILKIKEKRGNKMRECACCGKEFLDVSGRQKYCDAKCRSEMLKLAKPEEEPKKDPLSIAKKNAEARGKKLTYGQLQAQKYLENLKCNLQSTEDLQA